MSTTNMNENVEDQGLILEVTINDGETITIRNRLQDPEELSDLCVGIFMVLLFTVDLICAPNAMLCGVLSMNLSFFFIISSDSNGSVWFLSFISSYNGLIVSFFGFVSSIYQLAYNKILADAGFPDENFNPYRAWMLITIFISLIIIHLFIEVITFSPPFIVRNISHGMFANRLNQTNANHEVSIKEAEDMV